MNQNKHMKAETIPAYIEKKAAAFAGTYHIEARTKKTPMGYTETYTRNDGEMLTIECALAATGIIEYITISATDESIQETWIRSLTRTRLFERF